MLQDTDNKLEAAFYIALLSYFYKQNLLTLGEMNKIKNELDLGDTFLDKESL